MSKLLRVFVFCVLQFVVFVANAQCAMCKAALETSKNNSGFNDAILYLMLVPYLIAAAAIGIFIYILNKKKVEQ